MKIKQNIPWYKSKYLNRKNWLVKDSRHYIFYYFKNSLAERDINKIIKIKERHYKKIISLLGVKNYYKIQYYIYPTIRDKKRLMGDDGLGNSIWKEIDTGTNPFKIKKFEIHVIYNGKYKFIGEHEDTHLLSLYWGMPVRILEEGFAQFMEGKLFDEDIDSLSRELLKKKKLYSIEWLFDDNNWNDIRPEIFYPQVGSFIRYLINNYGFKKFRKVYTKTSRKKKLKENISIIKKNYSKSIEEFKKEWKNYLKSR